MYEIMKQTKKLLKAENLVKNFGERRVVNNVSIEVKAGEIVGLLGPNGAGKSTSFYMITGRILPDAGIVTLDGKELTALPMYMRARAGIGYLPQEASIFRNLTVLENLGLVFEESGIPKKEREEIIEFLLDEYGIRHLKQTIGVALSGGERRRVEIARALAVQPSFILLDEPFSGIDPIAVAELQRIIKKLKQDGYGILLTDHNVRETLAITDRAYLIYEGKVFLEGKPSEIIHNHEARVKYLGEGFTW